MTDIPSASSRPSAAADRQSPTQPRPSSDQPQAASRRNRTALRDYYRLKGSVADADQSSPTPSSLEPRRNSVQHSDLPGQASVTASVHGLVSGAGSDRDTPSRLDALDKPGFDAGPFVRQILETEDLKGLLALENGLMAGIKSLDGERKALVYDNYSKLISATDTIKKMRTNMDPLAPATSTLAPAIAHIADMASSLANELQKQSAAGPNLEQVQRTRQALLINRAVNAPECLMAMLDQGRRADADKEWALVQQILSRLDHAPDSLGIRRRCAALFSA